MLASSGRASHIRARRWRMLRCALWRRDELRVNPADRSLDAHANALQRDLVVAIEPLPAVVPVHLDVAERRLSDREPGGESTTVRRLCRRETAPQPGRRHDRLGAARGQDGGYGREPVEHFGKRGGAAQTEGHPVHRQPEGAVPPPLFAEATPRLETEEP